MKTCLSALSIGLILVCPAGATLVTFDDITPQDVQYTGGQIPQGYAGLGWNNFNWGQSSGNGSAGSWGQSCITSGLQPFTFNGAYLRGDPNTEVEVRGVGLGVILYTDIVVLNSESTWVAFNYVGINSVFFAAPGQFGNPIGSTGLHFSMDNLVINESTAAVPEPGTWLAGALLLPALIAGTLWRLCRTS